MDKQWFYSKDYQSPCQVIESQSLWGETICRVWLPGSNAVVRIPASRLLSIEHFHISSPDIIAYVAAAARVSDALTQDVLLAPMESTVIPLPHQIKALSRAIAGDRVRYLLADEVGLGKTIEAGLIMKELKLRGMVRRTLVIAPKGLVTQWISEMNFHFNELFHLVLPEDMRTLKRLTPVLGTLDEYQKEHNGHSPSLNAWRMFAQVVVPIDSVKPMDKRRGWSASQVNAYNRDRFEDMISAGWDLVIVDEAHRLGGSTDQVARFKLGLGLSEASPYILFLTATPHQGKSDSFHRLMSLIDPKAFPDMDSVTRDQIKPYVIRTEKRKAIDAEGKPLFKPRLTQLVPVSWEDRHHDQKMLYEAVTEYVRIGYNQAIREKRSYIGFLMILMQRLVVSSTKAIRTTLERRLQALTTPEEQLTLFPLFSEEDWEDLDGQEQVDTILDTPFKSLKNERSEVKLLLEKAAQGERAGSDAKAEMLLDWIYRLQAQESDPELKVIVFTEFVPTQEMLRQFLTDRGFSVVCLNGTMNMDERKRVQESFADKARILISTDAGGEGLNLQFCHIVINYDIPWNPMRLEQRIGRVDRIGQKHLVRAINFVFEDSVEHRVREVLEEKLAIILNEFGVDKAGDVLDSVQAGRMYEDLYMKAILNPEDMENSVDTMIAEFQDHIREAQSTSSILGTTEDLDPGDAQRLLNHPMPYWVERMTVSYLRAYGGQAEKKGKAWQIVWPDGDVYANAVFTQKEAENSPGVRHITLEETRIRGLATQLPIFAPGQPIPVVSVPGLADEVCGTWSIWRVGIASTDWSQRKFMPLFRSENGMVYTQTARHIWDQLLAHTVRVRAVLDTKQSKWYFEQLKTAAEAHGEQIFDILIHEHRERLRYEQEKADHAFSARRKLIGRIGLPQVRNYRLRLLEKEIRSFQEQQEERSRAYPEMAPLLVIHIDGAVHG
jgi:superfamily II DNA or RNA helicase